MFRSAWRSSAASPATVAIRWRSPPLTLRHSRYLSTLAPSGGAHLHTIARFGAMVDSGLGTTSAHDNLTVGSVVALVGAARTACGSRNAASMAAAMIRASRDGCMGVSSVVDGWSADNNAERGERLHPTRSAVGCIEVPGIRREPEPLAAGEDAAVPELRDRGRRGWLAGDEPGQQQVGCRRLR